MSTEHAEPEGETTDPAETETPERPHWVEVVANGVTHRWPDDTHAWTTREDHLVIVRLADNAEVRVGESFGAVRDVFAGATEVARFREWSGVVRTRDLDPWRQHGARRALVRAGVLPADDDPAAGLGRGLFR